MKYELQSIEILISETEKPFIIDIRKYLYTLPLTSNSGVYIVTNDDIIGDERLILNNEKYGIKAYTNYTLDKNCITISYDQNIFTGKIYFKCQNNSLGEHKIELKQFEDVAKLTAKLYKKHNINRFINEKLYSNIDSIELSYPNLDSHTSREDIINRVDIIKYLEIYKHT